MAPVTFNALSSSSSVSSVHFSRQDVETNSNFHSTPVEAVIVPIVVLILILSAAAGISVFSYWRRRNDRDRLIKAATPKAQRKYIPDWLGNWLGPAGPKPLGENVGPPRNARNASQDSLESLSKLNGADFPRGNGSADVIALRPISLSLEPVLLPPHPLTTYDPRDRNTASGRPKVGGIRY